VLEKTKVDLHIPYGKSLVSFIKLPSRQRKKFMLTFGISYRILYGNFKYIHLYGIIEE
jgi:hypothetical protein